mmetsp:Transcript_42778/g.142371  ORF Transcript_42778/g.142371 Transcript_42778/m.142371 type:complete len:268 (+) Transcript_42778:80-883(+)
MPCGMSSTAPPPSPVTGLSKAVQDLPSPLPTLELASSTAESEPLLTQATSSEVTGSELVTVDELLDMLESPPASPPAFHLKCYDARSTALVDEPGRSLFLPLLVLFGSISIAASERLLGFLFFKLALAGGATLFLSYCFLSATHCFHMGGVAIPLVWLVDIANVALCLSRDEVLSDMDEFPHYLPEALLVGASVGGWLGFHRFRIKWMYALSIVFLCPVDMAVRGWLGGMRVDDKRFLAPTAGAFVTLMSFGVTSFVSCCFPWEDAP